MQWIRRAYAALPPAGWELRASANLWRRFQSLQGTFTSSRSERALYFSAALFFVIVGAFMLGYWLRPYIFGYYKRADHAFGIGSIFLFVMSAGYFLRSRGFSYDFGRGTVTARTRSGAARWCESVAELPRVSLTSNLIGTYITLRWPDRRRRIIVWASLRNALDIRAP